MKKIITLLLAVIMLLASLPMNLMASSSNTVSAVLYGYGENTIVPDARLGLNSKSANCNIIGYDVDGTASGIGGDLRIELNEADNGRMERGFTIDLSNAEWAYITTGITIDGIPNTPTYNAALAASVTDRDCTFVTEIVFAGASFGMNWADIKSNADNINFGSGMALPFKLEFDRNRPQRAYVSYYTGNSVAPGARLEIPLVVKTASSDPVTAEITSGGTSFVSDQVLMISAESKGTKASVEKIAEGTSEVALSPIYIDEVSAGTIKSGGEFIITAPRGYRFKYIPTVSLMGFGTSSANAGANLYKNNTELRISLPKFPGSISRGSIKIEGLVLHPIDEVFKYNVDLEISIRDDGDSSRITSQLLAVARFIKPVTAGFTDVPPSHWAYSAIMQLVSKGALSGYPDGTFKPNGLVTRSEFAVMMTRALDIPLVTNPSQTFVDVGRNAWDFVFVETAKAYLTGYKQGNDYYFKGNESAMREDMAVALVKAMKLENQQVDVNELKIIFRDYNDISPNLQKYVLIAYKNNLISGYPDGTFGPKRFITRAEAAALLVRALDSKSMEKVTFDTIVSTFEASAVSSNSAMLNGSFANNSGTVEYGFYWGTESNPESQVSLGTSSASTLSFSYDFSGYLQSDTTFYFKAYAGTAEGAVLSFNTSLDRDVTVSTYAASMLSSNSAVLNGSFANNNAMAEYGFYWGTTPRTTTKEIKGTSYVGPSGLKRDFTYDLTGLEPDTTYYFRAYAGESEGELQSFTTLPISADNSSRFYPGVFSDVPKPDLNPSWKTEILREYTPSLITDEYGNLYEGFDMQIKYSDKSFRYNANDVADKYFRKLEANGFAFDHRSEIWGTEYNCDFYLYVKDDIYVEVDVFDNIHNMNGIIVRLSSGDFGARAHKK